MMKQISLAGLITLFPAMLGAFDLRLTSDALEQDLRAASLLVSLAEPGADATPQDVVAAAQAEYARLIGLMYDRGYFAPIVSIKIDNREAAGISPIAPPRAISKVLIQVSAGPPFQFGTARVTPLADGTDLPSEFATGQPATTSTLREAVDAGITGWREIGHAKAALASQDITARHKAARLDAIISLRPGPQLRFGDLRIKGNERMRTGRIRDIAGLPTGRVFDPDELDRASTRLRRTGVFSVVSLTEAEAISAGDTLDIDAQVVEAKLRRFGFGAEMSTQEGLSLTAYWLHRNLFGGGERLRIGGEISGLGGDSGGEDYELTLSFGRPATLNEDTDLYATAEVASLNEPNFSTDRVTLEAGFRRYATARREYTLGVGFEAADSTDVFGSKSYRILTLPLSVKFDYRDNALDATKGYYARIGLTPFANISGTASGLRTSLDARAYYSFGTDDRVTLALRGQLGSVAGPALAEAPTDFLFYSGGGGTVRGQEYQSLGVDQGGEDISGGRSFLGLSSELRVRTGENLSIVGFYDAGYIGSEAFPDGSSGDWHGGAGLGIRYDTGIGPVRLDVAVPVHGPGDNNGFEVYIGIGQAF